MDFFSSARSFRVSAGIGVESEILERFLMEGREEFDIKDLLAIRFLGGETMPGSPLIRMNLSEERAGRDCRELVLTDRIFNYECLTKFGFSNLGRKFIAGHWGVLK
jgi:hypothetical protein